MKKVMVRAWEIAKEAVENFGGKAFEYLSGALKMAWAEVKQVLPKLEGSAKQVSWAEDIRKAYFEKVEEYMEERPVGLHAFLGFDAAYKTKARELAKERGKSIVRLKKEDKEVADKEWLAEVSSQADASFWIDRYKSLLWD